MSILPGGHLPNDVENVHLEAHKEIVMTTTAATDVTDIESIKTNWANARRIAKARGSVLSYRAFAAAKDSTRGWDVMLMTEYSDSTAWSNREPIFEAIFESEEFVFVEPGSPSAAMRTFFVSDVAMQHFVNQ